MSDPRVARVTEYLEVDLDEGTWRCERCGQRLGPAERSYKEGCLVFERDPREIHDPVVPGEWTFAPDPEWCRIVEFYCPGCGVMVENEYLPPGHPITTDIELDLEALRRAATPAQATPAATTP
ncbi:MAG TPA: acetone carboxylase subunit gamma [Solirubrobacteraceae bacterium]|jgi:acetophenone carboxylase|nr:acetone carboxylase subunit gamma [Solirubrobacteraceae bacterium]